MPLRSPRGTGGRDLEKAQHTVRFVDDLDDSPARSSTDSDLAARSRLLAQQQQHQPATSSRRSLLYRIISPEVIPWILTCVFASTTIWLLMERPETMIDYGSYETRFSTDLKSLNQVPLEKRRFTGSPLFDENGTMTLASDPQQHAAGQRWPENRVYTGEPSQALDDNWEDLIGDRYFSISEDEAVEAWGEHRFAYVDEERGGYTAGLDVFHTLHCLNQIRMALYPDHYTHHGMPVETRPAHTAHCLDALRQHIQCYGSTTLIPTQWRDTAQRQYIDSNQEHVCRDFSYLRDFVRRRNEGGDLYVHRDKSLMGLGGKGPGKEDELAVGELKVVEGEVTA